MKDWALPAAHHSSGSARIAPTVCTPVDMPEANLLGAPLSHLFTSPSTPGPEAPLPADFVDPTSSLEWLRIVAEPLHQKE